MCAQETHNIMVRKHEIRIPVVIGPNRLHGNSKGAMIDDEPGEAHLQILQRILAEEARLANVEPTREWLGLATRQVLTLYEKANAAWVKTRSRDTIGHIYGARMPSGRLVLLGTREILARLPSC